MDKTRWVLTAVAVAVATTILDLFFHSIVLSGAYAQIASTMRPQEAMGRLMPLGWASTLILSFILVYLYHRGYEGKGSPLAEGLRFGLVIGLFSSIPMAAWCYVVFPISPTVAIGWFLITMIDMLAAGAIVGLLYRRAA